MRIGTKKSLSLLACLTSLTSMALPLQACKTRGDINTQAQAKGVLARKTGKDIVDEFMSFDVTHDSSKRDAFVAKLTDTQIFKVQEFITNFKKGEGKKGAGTIHLTSAVALLFDVEIQKPGNSAGRDAFGEAMLQFQKLTVDSGNCKDRHLLSVFNGPYLRLDSLFHKEKAKKEINSALEKLNESVSELQQKKANANQSVKTDADKEQEQAASAANIETYGWDAPPLREEATTEAHFDHYIDTDLKLIGIWNDRKRDLENKEYISKQSASEVLEQTWFAYENMESKAAECIALEVFAPEFRQAENLTQLMKQADVFSVDARLQSSLFMLFLYARLSVVKEHLLNNQGDESSSVAKQFSDDAVKDLKLGVELYSKRAEVAAINPEFKPSELLIGLLGKGSVAEKKAVFDNLGANINQSLKVKSQIWNDL